MTSLPARALRAGRFVMAAGAAVFLASTVAQAEVSAPPGPTVEAIKKRGALNCGIDTGVPGFAFQDNKGVWHGIDIDYCRAIAAAVLGDPDKVKYTGTTAAARFTVLQAGEIDVLIRDSTLTFTRSTVLGLDEVAVNFYAGQGFLVRKSVGVTKAAELQGATICMVTGATLELNIADFARSTGAKIGSLLFDKPEEAVAAMEAGRCDGYTDDTGSLAGMRSTLKKPDDWFVMPETISKEPLGLHIRSGDPRWQKIIFWIDNALKSAEEFGITKANADQLKGSTKDPFILRLLGAEGDTGKALGLDEAWALRAIKVAGNYGEMYETHFGPKALNLPRGQNNLYTKGGLHYPLPIR
jgi:general L-amino acid transport system substrate-binding protein